VQAIANIGLAEGSVVWRYFTSLLSSVWSVFGSSSMKSFSIRSEFYSRSFSDLSIADPQSSSSSFDSLVESGLERIFCVWLNLDLALGDWMLRVSMRKLSRLVLEQINILVVTSYSSSNGMLCLGLIEILQIFFLALASGSIASWLSDGFRTRYLKASVCSCAMSTS
jgi:hypothetical protein